MALELASRIENERVRTAAVFSVHTLKPLDDEGIRSVLKRYPLVVVIEEHVARGGLGAQVKQIAWDSQATCRLHTFALQDAFLHVYGSQDDVRQAHGLSVDQIYPALSLA